MEQFLEELKGINWIRNAIYFVLFFLLLLLFFLIFISPMLGSYKKENVEYRKAEHLYRESSALHEQQQTMMQTFQEENRKVLAALEALFDEQVLKTLAADYFKELEVVNKEEPVQEGLFVKQRYVVRVKLKSPNAYYSFIHHLNSAGHIIKASFPIRFESDRDEIFGEFALEVFVLGELPEQKTEVVEAE